MKAGLIRVGVFFSVVWITAACNIVDIVYPDRKLVVVSGVVEDTLGNRLDSVRIHFFASGRSLGKHYNQTDDLFTDSNGVFHYARNFKDAPFNTAVAWEPYPSSRYPFHDYETTGCKQLSAGKDCKEEIQIVLKFR